MAETENTPELPRQRHVQEFEDPHYHDDDEGPVEEDTRPKTSRPQRRKLPPPRRRFEDD
jgi:hypothetical protein